MLSTPAHDACVGLQRRTSTQRHGTRTAQSMRSVSLQPAIALMCIEGQHHKAQNAAVRNPITQTQSNHANERTRPTNTQHETHVTRNNSSGTAFHETQPNLARDQVKTATRYQTRGEHYPAPSLHHHHNLLLLPPPTLHQHERVKHTRPLSSRTVVSHHHSHTGH